jgi:hypothetical protein
VLLTCRISSGALRVTNRLGCDAMNVENTGWVAALVGAGLLLGIPVAVYDANDLTLGLVIVIYCCVYELLASVRV